MNEDAAVNVCVYILNSISSPSPRGVVRWRSAFDIDCACD
jgi:hypothetical protein